MNWLAEVADLDFPAPLPATLLAVEQRFETTRLDDLVGATRDALAAAGLLAAIHPGESVAVGVGSRGIANLATIVATVIDELRRIGAAPFITPAMGSHGGATAEGQRRVLAELGITPERVGAAIRPTMEVQEIGRIPDGPALYQDTLSAAANHTLLINRIKPHTSFHGQLESGLAKMAVVGLGKDRGAAEIHAWGVSGFQRFLAPAARIYGSRTNLRGGIAIVENGYDQTAQIVGLDAGAIGGPQESALLERARSLMPSLPFPTIDLLVVRQLGKNISGTGMDTNIVNRLMIPRQPEPVDPPDIGLIAVLDLTPETKGNANGIGLANVTTARLAAKIDWHATYTNAITAGILGMRKAGLPLVLADDRRALQVALRGCGEPPAAARLVFIRDTLTLDRLWVSPNLREAVETHPRLQIAGEVPLAFDGQGALLSPWVMAPATEMATRP